VKELPFTRPSLGEEELALVQEVLRSGWITSGPKVLQLETELAGFIGGDISVRLFNSATSALEAVLLAAGIGPGDEVIVPAMSFVASANVVVRTGATPVFVDVDLRSRNLSAETIGPALTDRTRALLPVHFAGMPVELAPIYALAERAGLLVLEDAAQAIGSSYRGRQLGSAGNPVVFSFHPNKNMTTIEGGAVATSDTALIERLQRIRFHGIARDDEGNMVVEEWGGKMNLPDVCAAVGLAQLDKLPGFNRKRRELAQRYLAKLPRHPALVLPADAPGHSWHMLCVCLDHQALGTSRAQVIADFKSHGILLGIHYPAMHLFPLYRRLGYGPGDFPVAERIGSQTLTLPLFPAMDLADVDRVCAQFSRLLESAFA
jgi:dTDP-4-amino-4,6-dideoxygalactose transaminase